MKNATFSLARSYTGSNTCGKRTGSKNAAEFAEPQQRIAGVDNGTANRATAPTAGNCRESSKHLPQKQRRA